MKSLFTVYSQQLAGYLMMNGFSLLRITENNQTGMNNFIFANVPMLHDYIERWQIEKLKLKQNNKITED